MKHLRGLELTEEFCRTGNIRLVTEEIKSEYKEWMITLYKLGIYLPSAAMYDNYYSQYSNAKKDKICLFFSEGDMVVNVAFTEGNRVAITHNKEDSTENNTKADTIALNNSKYFYKYIDKRAEIIFPYKNSFYSSFGASSPKDYGYTRGAFYTEVAEGYERMCNHKWAKSHRLTKFINDPDFEVRELTDSEFKINAVDLHNRWVKFKKEQKSYSYGKFYSRSYKEGRNAYDEIIGMFYKDVLLAIRMSVRCGDDMLYTYIENSVTGINDTEYVGALCKYVAGGICKKSLLGKINESNKIGNEIIKLKENNKFKQAISLTKNKLFLATLQNPIMDKETIRNVYLEDLKEVEKTISGFITIRVKHLFLYKLMEFYKNKGIKAFSVDAGVDKALTNYKESVNTGHGGAIIIDRVATNLGGDLN